MNKLVIVGMLLAYFVSFGHAEEKKDTFVFSPVKVLKITSIKNQYRTGTCWCFSTNSFLESELLRMGKGEKDLSEMFVVNYSYKDKAEKYVRLHGKLNFSQGGSFYDPMYVLKHYGAVPEEVMTGLEYGEDKHIHSEMCESATAYVDAVIANKNGKLSPVWKKGFDGIIDSYLGEIPEKFTFEGKEYTPMSYAESLGLNVDDYVSITSYTHHPFYTAFPIEVEDNWRWSNSYNVPLNEMMEIMENAINTGYTIAWGSDVSEIGFTRNGVALMPDVEAIEANDSDQAKWVGLSSREKDAKVKDMLTGPLEEKVITQEMRQEAYDNYQTTDDHGMQIYGIAKDQNGKEYFMVKNSWGTNNKYNGTWYASKSFVAYKTMNFVVHKDALPKSIKAKLGIK